MECSCAVLEQIRREVEQARNSYREARETGGVLFGIHEREGIRILAARLLQCEHALGPGFVLSQKDEKRLAQLIAAPATDPELKGLEALGWYHSHLRSRICLSERDLQIHSRYFDAPSQVALVVRRESERPARAGFFFREASGEMRTESSYEEFSIEAPPPAATEVKPPVVSKPAPSHRRTPPPPHPQPRQREAICPKCGSTQLRRSRRTGPIEQVCALFGFFPYRCHECLSRPFLKTSNLLERARSSLRRRPEERRRARERTRREILLWGGGILGFLAILYYLVRDTGAKPDQP
jgi:proteasome lid subunit RPN8/RPN11